MNTASQKYRKKIENKQEVESIFNEIRLKKTTVTLWQTLPNGMKNLRGGYVTSHNRNTNLFTFSPLDGEFFDFVMDFPICMYCGIKGFFATTKVKFSSKQNLCIFVPEYDDIKLTEGRGHGRFKINNPAFLTSFFYEGKQYELENFDISQGGIGLRLQGKDRWTFQLKKNVDIISVGPSLGEISCPRKAEIAHMSEIVIRDQGPTHSVIVLGLRFSESLSEADFLIYVEKLSHPSITKQKKKAA